MVFVFESFYKLKSHNTDVLLKCTVNFLHFVSDLILHSFMGSYEILESVRPDSYL